MKFNLKTIDSAFDENTGISKTIILTDIGKFTGFAKLHPDDKEYASRYAGCRYAEIRATIKYLKVKKAIARNQIKELNKLLNEIRYKIDRQSIEAVIKIYKNQLDIYNKNILLLKDMLLKTIQERERLLNKNS